MMQSVPSLLASARLTDKGLPTMFGTTSGHSKNSPNTEVGHFVYVDNLGVLSTDSALVETALREVTLCFDSAGLLTHEHDLRSEEAFALGCWLDGAAGMTRLTLERFWKVRRGLDFALSLRRLPGRVWRIILGHLTYVGLVARDSLSCFSTIYAFIEKFLDEPTPLWPTCRAELEAFRGIMVLLCSSWRGGWSPLVIATDASESGYGVTGSFWKEHEVAEVGRGLERRRFL